MWIRHNDIPPLDDHKLPPEAEEVTVSSSGVQDNVEEDVEAVVISESSFSGNKLAWVEENSDAPNG